MPLIVAAPIRPSLTLRLEMGIPVESTPSCAHHHPRYMSRRRLLTATAPRRPICCASRAFSHLPFRNTTQLIDRPCRGCDEEQQFENLDIVFYHAEPESVLSQGQPPNHTPEPWCISQRRCFSRLHLPAKSIPLPVLYSPPRRSRLKNLFFTLLHHPCLDLSPKRLSNPGCSHNWVRTMPDGAVLNQGNVLQSQCRQIFAVVYPAHV